MKANEDNFVDLIRKSREEGLVYVIRTYGGLLKSIVQKGCSLPRTRWKSA